MNLRKMIDFDRLLFLNILLFSINKTLGQAPTNCERQVNIQSGDTCWKIANDNHISVDDLHSFNKDLNCDLLQPNQSLCVSLAKCQKSVNVKSGDTCWLISSSNGISLSELQDLNPPGVNCDMLKIGQVICISLKVDNETSTPESSSCKTVTIKSGDTCYDIATANGITVLQLQELNSEGFDCNALMPGQVVCIGKENETNQKPKPQCKYVTVKSGDTCSAISISNGLTLDQLNELNVDLDCSKLMPGDSICIGNDTSSLDDVSCKKTKVSSGDTCWFIATVNDLTVDQLEALNPSLDCSRLMPGQSLCISKCDSSFHPKVPSNCKTVYTQEERLTCGEIETKFGLADGDLSRLNSNYSCCENKTFVLPLGRNLCVDLIGEIPKCLQNYVISPGDSCWSISVAHRLAEYEFYNLNPGINCSLLIPGKSVCIANQNISGQECMLTVIAQPGDSCQSVAQKIGITMEELQNLNKNNLNCQNLQAQQAICISNDQRYKQYENSDQGPTKEMLQSTVQKIISDGLSNDQNINSRLEAYLAGRVPANEIVYDLSKILGATSGIEIIRKLESSNKKFQDFTNFQNENRPLLCKSLSTSPYKTCICDTSVPFLHCQAQLFHVGAELSRKRRDLQYFNTNTTQIFSRLKRATKGGKNDGVSDLLKGNPLQGFLDTLCGGCISSESACIDVDVCAPVFVILEVCLGAGFCVPNPLTLIKSDGHITVDQFTDSRVGIDLSLCIVFLNEILKAFGADACIAKGGVDYFYLKQQLHFHGTLSLLVVRGTFQGRVQVAEPFSEGVYDTQAKSLLDDMCTEEQYQCEDYCQVPSGDVFLEYKVEGWLFGWHNIAKGSKNDPPPCKPKPKKIEPPMDSLNRIVLYTTSWAQYRAFNATIDGKFITRPDSCKPHARTPKDIDPSVVTHVNYAFLIIDANSFELINFEKNDDQLIAEMNGLKGSNSDLKTLISIGGWSFSQGETNLGEETKNIFSNMAKTEEGRARFIKSAVDYVIRNGMDGIDIDWEYPLASDRDSFTALLRELRGAISESGKDLLLTFAAPAGRKWYSNIDLENVHEYADFINLMTYDFHGGSFEAGMGPNVNAPIVDCSCPEIEDIELGLEAYLSSGVPSQKINLGMATYGRTFTLDSDGDKDVLRTGGSEGAGKQGVCTLTPGVLSYYEIKDLVSDDQVMVDKTLMSAYARFDSNQWVGYDTKETHNMKMCFARRKGLGGIMVWDAEMDDNLELVKNIKSNIASGDCDKFELPDCPASRKKRAAIRRKPSRTPTTKKPGSAPECDTVPPIQNRDVTAMKKCKGTKAGSKCPVVCKKNYDATEPDITCTKVGLKGGRWLTNDVTCELNSPDCGSKPYPIIRVGDNGGSGATLYYARIDPTLKLPIWSLYAQKIFSAKNPGRIKRFTQHPCHKSAQFLTSQYNGGGYHRGHLSPQDAFSFSVSAMKATNLMINVAAQDGSTNSGMWATLESKVKDFLQDSPGYVVTGICTKVKYSGKLPVPDCFWKMICTKTKKGTTTVGVFYHENTKAATPLEEKQRIAEVKEVRDQSFVLTKATGPGANLADVWTTAAKLSTTVAGLPNAAVCASSLSLASGGIGDLFKGGSTSRGVADGEEDLKKFWDDNIGSDKYGRKWDVDYPEEPEEDDQDEEDEEEEDDDDDEDDYPDDESKGAGGNILSGKTRHRCGHEIKY